MRKLGTEAEVYLIGLSDKMNSLASNATTGIYVKEVKRKSKASPIPWVARGQKFQVQSWPPRRFGRNLPRSVICIRHYPHFECSISHHHFRCCRHADHHYGRDPRVILAVCHFVVASPARRSPIFTPPEIAHVRVNISNQGFSFSFSSITSPPRNS